MVTVLDVVLFLAALAHILVCLLQLALCGGGGHFPGALAHNLNVFIVTCTVVVMVVDIYVVHGIVAGCCG